MSHSFYTGASPKPSRQTPPQQCIDRRSIALIRTGLVNLNNSLEQQDISAAQKNTVKLIKTFDNLTNRGTGERKVSTPTRQSEAAYESPVRPIRPLHTINLTPVRFRASPKNSERNFGHSRRFNGENRTIGQRSSIYR